MVISVTLKAYSLTEKKIKKGENNSDLYQPHVATIASLLVNLF